jgi:hypothetical protein
VSFLFRLRRWASSARRRWFSAAMISWKLGGGFAPVRLSGRGGGTWPCRMGERCGERWGPIGGWGGGANCP